LIAPYLFVTAIVRILHLVQQRESDNRFNEILTGNDRFGNNSLDKFQLLTVGSLYRRAGSDLTQTIFLRVFLVTTSHRRKNACIN
jgi:hypothetical protein